MECRLLFRIMAWRDSRLGWSRNDVQFEHEPRLYLFAVLGIIFPLLPVISTKLYAFWDISWDGFAEKKQGV